MKKKNSKTYAKQMEKKLLKSLNKTQKTRFQNQKKMYSEWDRLYSQQGLPKLVV